MKKFKVGLLTMSDGREYLHQLQYDMNLQYQHDICKRLEDTGLIEVIEGAAPVHSNYEARKEGERFRQAGAEVTIFNYAIWCYPQFTAAAVDFAPGPYILFCNIHPSECGMVGMMAAAGMMDQLGLVYEKIWGDIGEDDVLQRLLMCVRGMAAVNRLRGNTYGNFGGRPMGMYTAVANLDQWKKKFGIDVENLEQYDILRYGEAVPQEKVRHAREWLEQSAGRVEYNNTNLTVEKLEKQIRSYYALRKLAEEKKLDFLGIKAHGDLTDWYVTMDIAEAFLNDPYDWDGPHEPIVAATESDMDGALTMQIFKYMTGSPVLFADVRHYEKSKDLWFFGNSGTAATYYAAGSWNPKVNMRKVSLLPETKDYPAGGASVHHFAAPGKMTMARLARKEGEYYLTLVPAEIVNMEYHEMQALASRATPQWPVAFTKLSVPAEKFLSLYPCNHIHGVYGDWISAWKCAAKAMGIKVQILD